MRPKGLDNENQSAPGRILTGLAMVFTIAFGAINFGCPMQAAAASEGASLSSVSSNLGHVAGGETLHVLVGHSLFLNTRSRLSRVYVADPAVLNSVTLTPTQIVVTAIASGISTLVLLDETGQAQSYIVSADLDVAGLRVAMSEATHNNAVKIEGSGNRITLSGEVSSPEMEKTVLDLAGLYTKEVANALTITPDHAKQVRLKVRILEVDRSKALQMGINLFNPGGNTSFLASTSTSQYPSTSTYSAGTSTLPSGSLATTNPLNFLLYSTKLNLGANIQDLESKQVLQILAEPTITTISGEKAEFHSGGEFPFPTVTGTGSSATVSISFRPYGVALVFTPIVNEDGSIRLKVAPEVSALDYANAVTIDGYTIPALSTRKAETEVELRSDQSFAISGLLDQRTTDIMEKTPGAANIPILGALFKSKNSNHSTTELVVVVTPTLVDPLQEATDPAQPELPVHPLSTDTFDKSLGKNHNPQPAAPPINPPGYLGSQIPAATPSSAVITTPAAAESTAASSSAVVAATPASVVAPAVAAPPIVEDIRVPTSSAVVVPPTAAAAQSIPPTQPTQVAAPARTTANSADSSTSNNASAQALSHSGSAIPQTQAVTPSAAATAHAQSLATGTSAPAQTVSASSEVVYGPYIPYHPSGTTTGSTVKSVDHTVPQVTASAPLAHNIAAGGSVEVVRTSGPMAHNINPSAGVNSSSHLMVQIMALSNPEGAESMVAALKRHGYDVTVNRDSQDTLLHLVVGPFANKTDAETMRQRLLRDGYNAIIK